MGFWDSGARGYNYVRQQFQLEFGQVFFRHVDDSSPRGPTIPRLPFFSSIRQLPESHSHHVGCTWHITATKVGEITATTVTRVRSQPVTPSRTGQHKPYNLSGSLPFVL